MKLISKIVCSGLALSKFSNAEFNLKQHALNSVASKDQAAVEEIFLHPKSGISKNGEITVSANNATEPATRSGGVNVVLPSLNVVEDYGCWCRNVEDMNTRAFGRPKDPLDAVCKKYTVANRCIQRDYPSCDVANVDISPYISITFVTVGQSLTMECVTTPLDGSAFDNCAYDRCVTYITAVADQLGVLTDAGNNQAYRFDQGFNPTTDCPGAGGNGFKADSCCGSYPYRKEYSSADSKDCCVGSGKIFNDILEVCCSDGNVRPTGQC